MKQIMDIPASATAPAVAARGAKRMPEALYDFIQNPVFRGGDRRGPTVAENRRHRPVLPNELNLADFNKPLTEKRQSELSGLMGQRILSNAYECDHPFPEAELAIPFLENHLFGWLRAGEQAPVENIGRLLDENLAHATQSAARLPQSIQAGDEPARMAAFAAIQLTGPLFSKELAIGRWSGGGWHGKAHPWPTACADSARGMQTVLADLAANCGFSSGPQAYWQFHLGSWMAIGNYLHGCLRDPKRFYEAIGAVLYDRLRCASAARYWEDILEILPAQALAGGPQLSKPLADSARLRGEAIQLLRELSAMHGEVVFSGAALGIAGMRRLWNAAEEDFVRQSDWAGQIGANQVVAGRYLELIEKLGVQVDPETYRKTAGEILTTHVHDADRLLAIESGEMYFWPSWGEPLRLAAGDMLYVPRHRLHGAAAASAECVYRQPVIDAELKADYLNIWK